METLFQDVRYALRNLVKAPGFATVTVLTLALGIGANTAIFSVVNGVVLRPLPYPEPERLMLITSQFPSLGFDQFWISAPEFIEFRDRNNAFAKVGGYRAGSVNLGTDQPTRVNSIVVTHELMEALDVRPRLGRAFTREDTLPGAEDVGILSYELWQREFAGDPAVIGRVVRADGVPTRLVGIMPPGTTCTTRKSSCGSRLRSTRRIRATVAATSSFSSAGSNQASASDRRALTSSRSLANGRRSRRTRTCRT